MGVKGLLSALKDIQNRVHISKFRGKRLGIDAFAWLHRAAFAALAETVAGQASDKPVKYCLRRALGLRSFGVEPYFVFDGRPLPSKRATNDARHEARIKAKLHAEELAAQGLKSESYKSLTQAVSIPWSMVRLLMQSLADNNIGYMVAPYEADAQLGYLSWINYIEGAISEDSDLMLYGCQRVLYKLDDAGNCICIEATDIPFANLIPKCHYNEDSLIILCALSGCDYTNGVKGIGLKKGGKFISLMETKTEDNESLTPKLKRLGSHLTRSGFSLPDNFIIDIKQAVLTFKHQTVFNPIEDCLTRRVEWNGDPEDFMGPLMSPRTAKQLTSGLLHPRNLEPLEKIETRKRPHEENVKPKQLTTLKLKLPITSTNRKKRPVTINHKMLMLKRRKIESDDSDDDKKGLLMTTKNCTDPTTTTTTTTMTTTTTTTMPTCRPESMGNPSAGRMFLDALDNFRLDDI